jgi:hypothetical protein
LHRLTHGARRTPFATSQRIKSYNHRYCHDSRTRGTRHATAQQSARMTPAHASRVRLLKSVRGPARTAGADGRAAGAATTSGICDQATVHRTQGRCKKAAQTVNSDAGAHHGASLAIGNHGVVRPDRSHHGGFALHGSCSSVASLRQTHCSRLNLNVCEAASITQPSRQHANGTLTTRMHSPPSAQLRAVVLVTATVLARACVA